MTLTDHNKLCWVLGTIKHFIKSEPMVIFKSQGSMGLQQQHLPVELTIGN